MFYTGKAKFFTLYAKVNSSNIGITLESANKILITTHDAWFKQYFCDALYTKWFELKSLIMKS